MKEKELYKIIGNLKPDECLKTRISSAVESKDHIKRERRPVFIPALMMLLICINLGAIAMFFSGDKLNTHWGETEFFGDDQINVTGVRNTATMKQQIDDFIAEMQGENGEFYDYITYYSNDPQDPYDTIPWYNISEPTNEEDSNYMDGKISFRRYVQSFPTESIGEKIYTDHEYLVRYNGNGFDFEDIVYVIESNSNPINYDENIYDSLSSKLTLLDLTYQELTINSEYYDVIMFESQNDFHLLRYYREIPEYNAYNSYSKQISSDDGDLDYATRTDYWKTPDKSADVVMPNITEMNWPAAKDIMKRYGINYQVIYTNSYHEDTDDPELLIVSKYSHNNIVLNRSETVNVYLHNYASENSDIVREDYE